MKITNFEHLSGLNKINLTIFQDDSNSAPHGKSAKRVRLNLKAKYYQLCNFYDNNIFIKIEAFWINFTYLFGLLLYDVWFTGGVPFYYLFSKKCHKNAVFSDYILYFSFFSYA